MTIIEIGPTLSDTIFSVSLVLGIAIFLYGIFRD